MIRISNQKKLACTAKAFPLLNDRMKNQKPSELTKSSNLYNIYPEVTYLSTLRTRYINE
jgi:hypothetical protein